MKTFVIVYYLPFDKELGDRPIEVTEIDTKELVFAFDSIKQKQFVEGSSLNMISPTKIFVENIISISVS